MHCVLFFIARKDHLGRSNTHRVETARNDEQLRLIWLGGRMGVVKGFAEYRDIGWQHGLSQLAALLHANFCNLTLFYDFRFNADYHIWQEYVWWRLGHWLAGGLQEKKPTASASEEVWPNSTSFGPPIAGVMLNGDVEVQLKFAMALPDRKSAALVGGAYVQYHRLQSLVGRWYE